MRNLIVTLSASAFACAAVPALSDDLYNEMNVKPLTAEQSAKLRSERDAAKAKWASMTQAQKDEVKKTAKGKKIADLNATELLGQNDDMMATSKNETAQMKAEREKAQADYAKITPDQKAALRKSAQQKRMAELNAMESAGQRDDMGRYMSY